MTAASSGVSRIVQRAGLRRGHIDANPLAIATGVVLAATALGALVALSGLNALILCVSLIVCGVILFEFRIGVVLLIVLMPLSGSALFPHAMLGITGLNPLNLLLVGTLASLLMHRVYEGSVRHFLPRPLWWLYIVPLLVAGALGARHVDEIVPGFYAHDMIEFFDVKGYLRDMVAKPLLMVAFALAVGAAVQKSRRPELLLVPAIVSIWVMAGMAVVFVLTGGATLAQLASSDQREFLSPLGLHANELGRLYAFAYALLLFSWSEAKRTSLKLALGVSLALSVAALLLTFSRSAFVGLIVVSGLYLLWRRKASGLTLLGVLVVLALFAVPGVFYERITAGFGSGLNAISAGRIDGLWLPLLPEVLRSPFWGHGLGSILWSEAMHRGGGGAVLGVTHPHSAYLQALLDMGLIGLVMVCGYFAHVWAGLRGLCTDRSVNPVLRGFFEGASAGLLSFLVTVSVDSSLLPKPEHALLWLTIGVMYGFLARRPSRKAAAKAVAQ